MKTYALAGLACLALVPPASPQSAACLVDEPRLTAQPQGSKDRFGRAVAVSGSWMAVGAPRRDTFVPDAGSVLLFQRTAGAWTQVVELGTAALATGDDFGQALAMESGALAVGAPAETATGTEPGRVHVFELSGTTWSEVFSDTPGGTDPMQFGRALALDGGWLAVGSPFEGTPDTGEVRVYRRLPAGWTFVQRLAPPGLPPAGAFGWSVAVSGSRIAVGAPEGAGIGQGVVRIFEEQGGSWLLTATIGAPTIYDYWFGGSVALDGDDLAIGVPFWGLGIAYFGAVYTAQFSGGSWTAPAGPLLPAGQLFAGDLGATLALDGDLLAAGNPSRWEVQLFERTGGAWSWSATLDPPGAGLGAVLGWGTGLGLDTGTLALGAPVFGNAFDSWGAVEPYARTAPPVTYGTPKVNSQGCAPTVSGPVPGEAGVPVRAADVLGESAGLLFFGVSGPAAIPFAGGALNVMPPLRRTPLQWSFGDAAVPCSGTYEIDLDAWIGANEPTVLPGTPVWAQYWQRDPDHPDGFGLGLTDALSFTYGATCP